MKCVTKTFVKKAYPGRAPWSRKGDFGRLLVIGGSKCYSGAPALAAMAALRSGCDLVTVAAPGRAADIIASFSPDLITEPVTGNHFASWHVRTLIELSKKHDAVVLGSGLGRLPETMTFVHGFLSRLENPCVIDADAIHALSISTKSLRQDSVITPHSGEFLSLTDQEPSHDIRERAEQAGLFSNHLGCTILLKGHVDVITDRSSLALNRTGNPCMTVGGTGDTLAGMCGALLSMGCQPFDAACSAAYLNGLSGDLAARRLGQSMLATDVLDSIPQALLKTLK